MPDGASDRSPDNASDETSDETSDRTSDRADPEVDGLSYEQARDELVGVVRQLEGGAASLEDSLLLWERGEALATRCQAWLDGARGRLAALHPQAPNDPADE